MAEKNENEEMYNNTKDIGEDCGQDCPSKASNEQMRTLESLYKYVLILSNIVGLHLVHRSHDGAFVTCRWAVVSFGVLNLICLMTIPPVVMLMFRSAHFWYKVILLPYAYGFFFCVYSYIQVVVHRHHLVNFLEGASNLKVPMYGRLFYQLVVWMFFFPIMIASCSMVMLVGEQQFLFALSIVVVSIVPPVLDVYMVVLVRILQQSLLKLTQEVETHEAWTLTDAQRVMSNWYHVSELLKLYNKVSSHYIGRCVINGRPSFGNNLNKHVEHLYTFVGNRFQHQKHDKHTVTMNTHQAAVTACRYGLPILFMHSHFQYSIRNHPSPFPLVVSCILTPTQHSKGRGSRIYVYT